MRFELSKRYNNNKYKIFILSPRFPFSKKKKKKSVLNHL